MKKIFKSFVSISTIITVVFSPLVSLSPAVFAADTGFNSPSANANSNNGWTNPQNAYISDNSRTSANSSSDIVQYYNFNFSIPTGVTINGIEVQIEGYTGGRQADVSLSWNGSSYTAGSGVKTTNFSGTESVLTFGGTSDTWNRTWLADEFTNNNFRVKLDATGGGSTLYVDQVQAKVYYTEPVQNPTLGQSCGLDIALVLDSSGSIDNNELNQMKDAFEIFVDAFLPETPTQFSVTDFGDTATVLQTFTADSSLINAAINTPTSGGYTNWEDGLLKAQSTLPNRLLNPDLVIFASDGNPNRKGNPAQSVSELEAVNAAIVIANSLKTSGTRIIALGIGNDLDIANLEKISSADAIYTSNFETLAEDLAELASQLCGGTITARKIIDEDGDLQTLGDQTPGEGWSFDVAGSQEVTDQSGYTNAVAVDEGTYSVTETLQGGYNLLDAYCSGSSGSNGTLSGTTISGIEVGNQDIISCVFYNSPQCIPSEEVCDGVDNDCDGYIDEDLTQPTANQNGLCTGNIEICSAGQWIPDENNYIPTNETCDNQDNNCDGNIDENLTQSTGNQNGLCSGNTETCYAGEWIADGGNYEPTDEVCDAGQLDEDCDGSSNEGCECIDGDTQQCGQTDVGLCEYGTQTCSGGVWGSCEGAVDPTEEICGNDLDEDCDGSDLPCPFVTINAYKIVCQTEADLPNWGNGGSDITETTAQDFVNDNQNCHLEEDWSFEWAYAGTANPGDNIIEPAGGTWTTFGPTDSNGLATTDIYSLSGDRIWVREVMEEGYILFSGDTTAPRDDVSAEFYCHQDVLNYDNYDYVLNPQLENTYYCVAFNSPTPEEPILGCMDPEATNYNPEATEDNGSCVYPEEPILGCMDPEATNYNPEATEDDGRCTYEEPQPYCGDETVNGDEECESNSDCGEGQVCNGCMCEIVPECTPQTISSCSAAGQQGVCAQGTKTCDESGFWGECLQTNEPTTEICNNQLDDDCDGDVDCNDNDCTEDANCLIPPSGGGGGGGAPIYLTISNEANSEVFTYSVIVSWFTNIPATTRVVYDTVPHDSLGGLPNYGYAFSTDEDSNKVTYHEVTITGLTSGTTYYWRAISHGSGEVWGQELSFTTTALSQPPAPPVPPGGETGGGETGGTTGGEEILPETGGEETGGGETVEEVTGGGTEEVVTIPGEEETPGGLNQFLAAIGTLFGATNLCWLLLILVIITIALLALSIKRREEKKKKWIYLAAAIILIVLYCIFCCPNCWFK